MASKKTRQELQTLFRTGAKPSEQDFQDIFDSVLNITDDGIEKPPGADVPLKILAWGDTENLLDFYAGDVHTWRLSQKPTETAGLSFETGGSSKLFLESASGNLGIGNVAPKAKLDVNGDVAIAGPLSIINTNQDPNGNTLILGPTDGSNLRLGYAGDYTWIQSHANKPLFINPLGNNVGIGKENPTQMLDVGGNVAIAGTLSVTQNATLTGNVGIGVAPGTEKLKVSGNAAISNVFLGDVGYTSEWAGFRHVNTTSLGSYALLQSSDGLNTILNAKTGGLIRFRINNEDKAIIDKDGKMGIGTTTPSAPLEIRATSQTSPANNGLYVYNSTNSANQNAILSVRVAGKNAGDPFLSWDVNGESGWSMGIDNSDGNKLKIARTWSSLTKDVAMTLDRSGKVEIPGNLSATGTSSFASYVTINSGGRNYFKDSEKSDGRGLRVGVAWGMYGIYAETGAALVGGAEGVNFQNGQAVLAKNGNMGIGVAPGAEKLKVGGNAAISNVFLGDVGHTSAWAGFSHVNAKGTGTYALLQSNDASNTILNAKSGGLLRFRTNNQDLVIIQEKGISINGSGNTLSLSVGGNNLILRLAKSLHGANRAISWDGDNNLDMVSDLRLKTDIENEEGILERLMQLQVKNYYWKDSPKTDVKRIGFVAQDVRPLFPALVGQIQEEGEDEPTLTLKYADFGVLAIGGLQELKQEKDAQIAALEAEVKQLKAQIQELLQRQS